MKITSVEIFDIKIAERPPWNPVIIRINTDEGISGLGEVGLSFGVAHSAGLGMVKDLSHECLIGLDPMRIEAIWELLFRNTFWAQGGGPAVYGGMSAIDEALWDIKGKALGVPVYQLLGGKTNNKLRAYASQIHFGWSVNPNPARLPEHYAQEALKALEQGYTAIKVDPLWYDENGTFRPWALSKALPNRTVKLVYNRMKAIREAVGPDIDIILELHGNLGTHAAIQIGQAMEEFNCMFYEEPIHSLNVDAMLKVAQNVKIPLSAGERIYTRWGYRQYFEKQVLSMIQPDLCLVGGITEGKKICDYANTYDIMVQCHVCGSPVSIACALQLEAVIPNFAIHEHVVESMKPANSQLIKQELQPKNGYFDIPDEPGLGIELDDKVVARYPCIKVS
jgi:galactonate dehydratase